MGNIPGGHPDWEAYFRKTFELLVDPELPAQETERKPRTTQVHYHFHLVESNSPGELRFKPEGGEH